MTIFLLYPGRPGAATPSAPWLIRPWDFWPHKIMITYCNHG